MDNKIYDIKITCQKYISHYIIFIVIKRMFDFNPEYNTEEQCQQKPINGNDESKDADISDILLWAIFANRKDIAEICWLRGDNHLCNIIFLICKFR